MKTIATALVNSQRAFGKALKQSTNPHFRSKYADLSSCIDAVIGALNENGIALIQHTHECDNGVIVETIFLHESGESLTTGKLHVPAVKHDAQGYGSALTYARRYSLMAACGIAPEDDDGNAASKSSPKPVKSNQVAPVKPSDTQEVIDSLNDCKSLVELAYVWAELTPEAREWHIELKDELKAKLSNTKDTK
jgi:hypothetical protein